MNRLFICFSSLFLLVILIATALDITKSQYIEETETETIEEPFDLKYINKQSNYVLEHKIEWGEKIDSKSFSLFDLKILSNTFLNIEVPPPECSDYILLTN